MDRGAEKTSYRNEDPMSLDKLWAFQSCMNGCFIGLLLHVFEVVSAGLGEAVAS